jgi:threonine/homoserine/homoserine lactone efflux protein
MLPASNAITFALASLALIAIPGPSVLFVVGRSLSFGRRGGVISVVGNAIGELPAIAAVALGVGTVVAESVTIFTIVKFIGAAYLIYLGVQAIRHRHSDSETSAQFATPPSTARLLREGFLVGVTNPKTVVFMVAVLPQFVDYRAGAIPLQLAILGLIFFTIALISDSIWALTAGTARAWLLRNPRRMSKLGATGGVMMIGLGGALALSGAKH